jgi:hypothetical protein
MRDECVICVILFWTDFCFCDWNAELCVCFITAGPITKLFAWGEEESGAIGMPNCVCVLLLQDLLQICSRGGRRRVEDMCYERRPRPVWMSLLIKFRNVCVLLLQDLLMPNFDSVNLCTNFDSVNVCTQSRFGY